MRNLSSISMILVVSACVSTPKPNALPEASRLALEACIVQEFQTEPEWSFVHCEVESLSSETIEVQFAPYFELKDPAFAVPTVRELSGLRKRWSQKSGGHFPLSGPAPSSSRPETFIFNSMVSLLSHGFDSDSRGVNLAGEQARRISPGKTQRFDFPLVRTMGDIPPAIKLRFRSPLTETIEVPLRQDEVLKLRLRK